MRNPDQQPHGRQGSPNPTLPRPAALALALAALLACAALLVFIDARQASAQDAPGRQQASQERERSGKAGGSETGGSGNALGVIVDIPEGWPLNDKGGGHDIVRFEKCFPFCNVERPDGGSSGGQDGGETVIQDGSGEQTSVIEQTQILEGTQTDEDETGSGNGPGNGSGEDEPEEPRITEETTVLEETTTFEGTTAPPEETAECPTGPSGPISEVTLREVLDADTLKVEGSDGNAYTIRLIGAEAPDLAGGGAEGGEDEPGAEEAAEFARETLGGQGQQLELEYDERKTDENGQTFAYVWTNNAAASPKPGSPPTTQLLDVDEAPGPVLFNSQLVESGYARAATAEPNTDYAGCLKQAEEAAREDKAGLWGEQASYYGPGSASGATATLAPIELASRKVPESNARANAEDAAIPPITGYVKAPEPVEAHAAQPGLAVGLALGLVAASVLAAVALTRRPVATSTPAGVGPTEGGGN